MVSVPSKGDSQYGMVCCLDGTCGLVQYSAWEAIIQCQSQTLPSFQIMATADSPTITDLQWPKWPRNYLKVISHQKFVNKYQLASDSKTYLQSQNPKFYRKIAKLYKKTAKSCKRNFKSAGFLKLQIVERPHNNFQATLGRAQCSLARSLVSDDFFSTLSPLYEGDTLNT